MHVCFKDTFVVKKICMVLLALLLVGCQQPVSNNSTEKNKLRVFVSFYPIYEFVQMIGGDRIELTPFVPENADAHHWEPTTKEMVAVQGCDLFFYNGLGMESFIEKVEQSVDNKDVLFVNLSDALNKGDIIEEDGEDTAQEHEENEHDHEDPHVWLNPQLAKLYIDEIRTILSEKDPINKNYYEQQYKIAAEKMDKLDTAFSEARTHFQLDEIIVSHEAYGYLCSAYQLHQIGLQGIHEDTDISPSKMAALTDLIKTKEIHYLFYENLSEDQAIQTLANETGCQLLQLNPFEKLTQGQVENGENYFTVMEQNLANLKIALMK